MLTTAGYVVGNLGGMPPRTEDYERRKPANRKRHFLREWRKHRGKTQEGLAEELGTTKATISRIEGRKIGYHQDFLESVADALGTHPATLLSRPPSPVDDPPPAPPPRGGRR